ncbi:MAG TPA: S1 RNA-binding domain-containing protein [Bacilli bacterium]|nr:S1 RNA-binding domain-containing protein [Bacilli bacterium]
MSDKLYNTGDICEGTVIEIRPYGAILAFDNEQEGLLHISEISTKFVRNIADFAPVGSKIQVIIVDVDHKSNFLRLSIKKIPQVSPNKRDSEKRRKLISASEIDFSPLEERLPKWIKEAKAMATTKKEKKL